MADPNQKLFAQMADLGRNISVLTDAVKKNTSVKESGDVKVEETSASPDNKKLADSIDSLNKTMQGVQKMLETKPASVAQTTEAAKKENPGLVADVKSKLPGFDFGKITGGFKDVIKAFQEGGVAPKDGKYLVGENGPEVVKLPKGSGVIPVNVKDLTEGLSKIPELSSFLKDDNLNYYGDGYSTTVMNKEGKKLNLRDLMYHYEDKADDVASAKTPDPIRQKELEDGAETIGALLEKGYVTVNKTISDVKKSVEETKNKAKYDSDSESDYKFIQDATKSIIDSLEDKDLYEYNDYTLAQADLIASQMLLDKRKEGPKDEFDKLGKIESKSAEIVNPKLADKKIEKPEEKEKSKGILSKIGLGKKDKSETDVKETEGEDKESKGSKILGKLGKGAEKIGLGVADKVLGNYGVSSDIVKKGIGALKKIGNKDETKEDKSNPKLDDAANPKDATNTKTQASLKIKEGLAETPKMLNDVKKLATPPKPESKKEADKVEAPKSPEAAKSTPVSTESKPPEPKKSESSKSTSDTGPLGGSNDIQDIKNALSRIASILEGPLTMSPLDSPFRPDSRRI